MIPRATPGQVLTAEMWNAMADAADHARIISGLNTRVAEVAGGTIITFDAEGATFRHPWLSRMKGVTGATVLPGSVNTIEATINGVKLSTQPAPVLSFPRPLLDAENAGYLAVEVTYDPEKRQLSKVAIVQVADPDSETGEAGQDGVVGTHFGGAAAALSGGRARWAIARLHKFNNSLRLTQIVHRNLTHRPGFGVDGKTVVRHFFY